MHSAQTSSVPLHLRVFLSSPGDVADERALARHLLKDELPYDPFLRGHVTIDLVSWDNPAAPVSMPATLTPQEAVNQGLPRPSECDVVVVILWSRMGTPLPLDQYQKPSGEPYLSGTEWEYEDAYNARPQPVILLYRRTEEPLLKLRDPAWEEKRRQYILAEQFFARFRNPDGSLRGGVTEYATPTGFKEHLSSDLRHILRERLGERDPRLVVPVEPLWTGSPYPGLRAFTSEEAAIFFGRGRETDALITQLRDPDQRFLAVVGASGTGKSSLIRAGLLPRLKDGAIEGSQNWCVLTFTPAEISNDPFWALSVKLEGMLPPGNRNPAREIAMALATAPQRITDYAAMILAKRPAGAALVLVIDQLEELFTLVTAAHRHAFIDLLRHAISDPRLRVLATLRADFISQYMAEPALGPLLQTGTFALVAPGPVALADMIRKPAERAGLDLEEGLIDEILKDAGGYPGALPLVAFCMEELYHRTVPAHRLTLAAYNALGGLRGAIGQQAKALLTDLRHTERMALDTTLSQLFRALIRVDAAGTATRRRAFREELGTEPPMPQLVEALVQGRLLIAEQTGGQATVTLADEVLLAAWPDLCEWLDHNRAQMQRLDRLLLSLRAPDPKDRWYATQALGEMGPIEPEVIPALITALHDADSEVRQSAAAALRHIGPAAAAAVPALITSLSDADPEVRRGAAETLGNIGPATIEAVPALITTLGDADAKVRVYAADALVQISPVMPEVVPALITALAHADPRVRDQAAEGLSNISPLIIKAVSALIAVLGNADEEMSRRAAESLMRIGPLAPELIPVLSNPQGVLGYYFRTYKGRLPLNEAKLIFVGSGGVGKTSLVNRLIYNTFNLQEQETKGISITKWPITLHTNEEVNLRIWDFGGQEIMHATHQFFLTQWSLYLLVLEGRQGREEEDAEYWLSLIDSFAAGSPVIVIFNKIKEHPFTVDHLTLQKKFPNVHNFIETDCKDRTGIDELLQTIQREVDRLEHLRDPFPTCWFAIKDRLAYMTENYLTFDRYQEICREEGETDVQAQESLAHYLHSMGIVLNYRDDPRLRDTHVLNPRWITEAIYRILNYGKLAQQKGELRLRDLQEILDAKEYPLERHEFLLELMKKFELCFRFSEQDDRYLVPELLSKEQPAEAAAFMPEQCLNFEYQYPILPEGLMPRFVVRTYVLSINQPRWRSGVILDLEGNSALIRGNKLDKCVRIAVAGPPPGRRRLLAVIRTDFERIHESYKFKPQEMVPVLSHSGMAIPYRKLLVMERKEIKTYLDVIGDDTIELNVKELLDGVDLEGARPITPLKEPLVKASRPILFYSYSHQDDQLCQELLMHLKLLERRKLISSWYDRKITAGTEWKGQIDENLERADIILLLVSPAFLTSDYCCDVEMKRAMERYNAGEAHVIPIIIRNVNWKSAPFGKLQALPRGSKPVWRSNKCARDGVWRDVEEGLERVLEDLQSRPGHEISQAGVTP